MFEHSIKVPRLYKQAAKILREVKEKRASLKELLYNKCKHTNLKGIYALVAETLKHYSQIQIIIDKAQLLAKETRLDEWLARIFITELLWKGKEIKNDSKPIKTVLSYLDELKKHKALLDSNSQLETSGKAKKPRFARINTLKISLPEAINGFRDEGWVLVSSSSDSYEEYLNKVALLGPDEFMVDLHVKELLLFPCSTEFHKHNAYRDGLIILQDKASCLAAQVLNPPPNSVVLDMCAAPGMKTTHLAAIMNNTGTVYAVEKSERRFQTLNKIVEAAGATNVKTIHKNVQKITPEECPNVEYILVDPSCSGSGITDRVEVDNQVSSTDPSRLQKLSGFQKAILNFALTNFPQAKKVVYSTCSIHSEENEQVVQAMSKHRHFKLVSAETLLHGPWKNSESKQFAHITKKCLCTNLEKDLTNGFFIAVFERDESVDFTNVIKPQAHDALPELEEKMFPLKNDFDALSKNIVSNLKTKRKEQKRNEMEENLVVEDHTINKDIKIENEDDEVTSERTKKKLKRKYIDLDAIKKEIKQEVVFDDQENMTESQQTEKKKKRKKTVENTENIIHEIKIKEEPVLETQTVENETEVKKHKKIKKERNNKDEKETTTDVDISEIDEETQKKKREMGNEESVHETEESTEIESKTEAKKHKKHKKEKDQKEATHFSILEIEEEVEKKKRRKTVENAENINHEVGGEESILETQEVTEDENKTATKKHKKHKKEKHNKDEKEATTDLNILELGGEIENLLKKHKKKKHYEDESNLETSEIEQSEDYQVKKHKKKKHNKVEVTYESVESPEIEENQENLMKKHEKNKHGYNETLEGESNIILDHQNTHKKKKKHKKD